MIAWWFSIVMLVYQRVRPPIQILTSKASFHATGIDVRSWSNTIQTYSMPVSPVATTNRPTSNTPNTLEGGLGEIKRYTSEIGKRGSIFAKKTTWSKPEKPNDSLNPPSHHNHHNHHNPNLVDLTRTCHGLVFAGTIKTPVGVPLEPHKKWENLHGFRWRLSQPIHWNISVFTQWEISRIRFIGGIR